ncbi:B-cadherin-like [Pelmatolapia mariae]|uniref:B-cadherin-like n=1 Tax=Pelmatolapia mariae TaxID=158779 RepID=UPI003211F86E
MPQTDKNQRGQKSQVATSNRTGIILNLAAELPSGEYSVILRVGDKHGLEQVSIIKAEVCDCRGAEPTCPGCVLPGASNLPLILGILGAILLLALLLLVLLFAKQRKKGATPVSALEIANRPTCVPGFESELLVFIVFREHLRPDMSLGKVGFTDCTERTLFLFSTDDRRFTVKADGTLTVNREVVLHKGHRNFFIHSWDSQGNKITVGVSVVHPEHHHGAHTNFNIQHHSTEVDSINHTEVSFATKAVCMFFQNATDPQVLIRKKRAWVIPPLNVPENQRGTYPLKVAQIRSSEKLRKIFYSITGPGADLPPAGRFIIDRETGNLYVTQPLDREETASYTFLAHAVAEGGEQVEAPMEIIVNVIDQNDNKPYFTVEYNANVAEATAIGTEVVRVEAKDDDEPNSDNSDLRYRILNQDPPLPTDNMFEINPVTGSIRVTGRGLDREKYPQYTLTVQAADLAGEGLTGQTKVILTVTDSNDNAPVFTQSLYKPTVDENKKDVEIVRMIVTDEDEPQTPAWNAKFKIISGDPDGLFTVKTGTNKQEGILSTAKELDFEKASKHTLLVSVENQIPFAGVSVVTSTATVVVSVRDVNEAPIFDPKEKLVVKPEDLAVDEVVVQYTASDPDTARKQTVSYKILTDPAGWLNVDKDTGLIKVRRLMDREAPFVTNNRYTAIIGAYDNDAVPATGTGTLIIQLEDVNDNAPVVEPRNIEVCNKDPAPQLLSVTDEDGPEFGPPYSVSLQGMSKTNWAARMNDSRTGIILNLAAELPSGEYSVTLRVGDKHGLEQVSIITAKVCDCRGAEPTCPVPDYHVAGALPLTLGILGAILLLALLLLVLLFAKQRKKEKKEPLLLDDGVRDNMYYYDEEGGGEDDQDYDLSVLHRGLDNRPDVLRNEVVPNFMPAPQYRPRPANPEEIGNFIEDNLKAADNDPTAPPYDSLLVFDYEGGGSDAGSLSSLNSSSSGDQNYDCLNEWAPRFKKLADMYGGGDDDDML